MFGDAQREGILAGRITMTVRSWARPQARVGGRYRVDDAHVVVADSVETLAPTEVTEADAVASGFPSLVALRRYLGDVPAERALTRVTWHVEAMVDPRIAARERDLDEALFVELRERLAAMDRRAAAPWTGAVLELIAERPRTLAARLASQLGRETQSFKADVRKLKALGLTRSLEVGYELSPLGALYLERLRREASE